VNPPQEHTDLADRAAALLTRHSTAAIAVILTITALLVFPMIFLHPEDQASQEPGGPVFDLRDEVNAQFPPRLHIASFIVEDREGDLLRQAPLWELYRNGKALRDSDMADLLFSGYDVETQRQLQGIYSLADSVNDALTLDPTSDVTLETASDSQVKEAINRILEGPQGRVMLESLSIDAISETVTVEGEERQEWRARAISIFVAADNTKLGGGPYTVGVSNDESVLDKERLNRRILTVLKGDEEHYLLWGVGLDANLTSREQGETAIPYIVATVILVLIVVGATLRSFKAVGLGFLGLAILVIWLRGISNLIGLNGSLILDLIVPIAMISLGADFLIHAVARYNEERVRSRLPIHALRAGLAGVLGALVLASLSDGIAFLANVTSGIESVIGFGVAAGIAVLSNFVIMGILIPLVIMRLDQRKALAEAIPAHAELSEDSPAQGRSDSRFGMAKVILTLARAPWAVLPLVALGTALTTYLAFQLDPQFDPEDFLDTDSEFVIGVNKLDEHIAPSLSGEPAIIYVRGDLTDPQSLEGLRGFLDRLGDNESVGRGQDGGVFTYGSTIFQLLDRVVGSASARRAVEDATGVAITDHNLDGQPDDSKQLEAAYEYMLDNGIPLDEQSFAYETARVREILAREGNEYATVITLGVLGAREQANLATARESLNRDVGPLAALPSISEVGITGSPFTREATLMATTRALTISLPIAAGACFLLLAFWMRSVGYAFITTLPVGLVVSWLYAFMYVTGYSLNFITATIAAVSIGVGIDYSIHMTQRFRQELPLHPNPIAALQTAAAGTGAALAGSAASSIAGFAVMGFAPMPLFSTYGIISAVMVLMAGSASLLVLPSMLLLVARVQGKKA